MNGDEKVKVILVVHMHMANRASRQQIIGPIFCLQGEIRTENVFCVAADTRV